MAPTLVTSCTALPPKGAVPPKGGLSAELAPTLFTSCAFGVALPLSQKKGAVLAWGGTALRTPGDDYFLSLRF